MMSTATHLFLIRHGHTASNGGSGALLSGRTDIPLSARGQDEVLRLRRRLQGAPRFDAVYSSPLRRALDTAAALTAEPAEPVRICPTVQEIDCGILDGMPLSEVQRRFPKHWAANLRQDDESFRWPGGESYREFRRRIMHAVHRLARAHRGGTIAIVTHAGVVSQIIGALRGLSPAAWGSFRPGNTGMSRLEWRRDSAALLSFDDRIHLAAATG
jgi:broad specificity phosphatase PhoE